VVDEPALLEHRQQLLRRHVVEARDFNLLDPQRLHLVEETLALEGLDDVPIGAGSAVVCDLSDGQVYGGCPARPLR